MTIGQYYPGDSLMHRLDARTKLIGTFVHIFALLMVNTFAGYGVVAAYVVVLILISQVPIRQVLRALRPILLMLSFAVALNLLLAPGENIVLQFFIITITAEGLSFGAQMALRLVLLILGTSLLTLTTSPIKLTDGIESLLAPLKIIKVPAHDIAMLMTLCLRFIPTLSEEMLKIMNAQKARGASLDTGNIFKRAKGMLPIIVPLFVSAFKRAEEIATAMESRCYRGDIGRTKMDAVKMNVRDYLGLLIIAVVSLGVIML